MLKFYLWVMGWSGAISAWAFRKQAAIVREHNRKEEEDYLKELKKEIMIGLFFIGMGATLIGALIAWWVINTFVIKNDKEE